MGNKFELTSETKIHFGRIFYRIRATASFGVVKKGDLGGFIEREACLSQDGDARVSPVNIIGLIYPVTISDELMRIGCECHTHADWLGFDDRRILETDGKTAARFWKQYGVFLLALCDGHAKKVAKLNLEAA